MYDQSGSQPQNMPMRIDMDQARRDLAQLAQEFGTLLAQEIRIAMKDAGAAREAPAQTPEDRLAPANIDRLMGNIGTESKMDDIARTTESILEAVRQIPAAIAQSREGQ